MSEDSEYLGHAYPPNEVPDYYLPTFTGKKFHFLNPSADEIDIVDIAHSLAGLPRYLCHTERPYSVAEHTVRLVWYAQGAMGVADEGARLLLLHDAAEAYIGEWPKPLKLSVIGREVRHYEEWIQNIIYRKYRVPVSEAARMAMEQLDRAIVYAETELSGQMKYDNLPILLCEGERWLGAQMYDYFRKTGSGAWGWGHDLSKLRFLSLAGGLGIS